MEQTGKRPKHRLSLALLIVAALIAAPFAPAFPLWFGIAILVLCAGAFIKSVADLTRLAERTDTRATIGKTVSVLLAVLAVVQDFSRRILRLNSTDKWRSGLRLAVYGLIGLVLIAAAGTGAASKAELERAAAKMAAGEAERQRLANEANAQVLALVAQAEMAWKADNLNSAQEKLHAASKIPNATELAPISGLRTRMANAKVQTLMAEAIHALNTGDIEAGEQKVEHALAIPHADALGEASRLDQQIGAATDPTRIRAALMELSQEAFQQFKENGTIPAQMVSGYEGLDRRTAELAKAEVEQVAAARKSRRLAQLEAERKRQEEAELAAQVARKRAEAEHQRKAKAEAEAARKAVEEYLRNAKAEAEAARKAEEESDAGGLVLLRKTVEGKRGQFGGEITGTVVNRRNRKLSYAQITFNLYDESGAQVGTALANISGLEPGGRWNFKATSFGTDFVRYKFSELSGF